MIQGRLEGPAFYCGDFVNTDLICPGRYEPFPDTATLARVALIDYESATPFVRPDTGRSDYVVIFAGVEFGCGSSRETAPQALHHAGARVVVARSFARIFYRNCVNMGLLLPIRYPHPFDEGVIGQHTVVDLTARTFTVAGQSFPVPDFGPVAEIIAAGSLTAYTKRRLGASA
ncbi:MAG TPA: 3-isopropylmalate dehydratase [Methylomirabilota bacterium]|nr:3-isopropylmalate dehydratase [Methylomirabilota bacterium]